MKYVRAAGPGKAHYPLEKDNLLVTGAERICKCQVSITAFAVTYLPPPVNIRESRSLVVAQIEFCSLRIAQLPRLKLDGWTVSP